MDLQLLLSDLSALLLLGWLCLPFLFAAFRRRPIDRGIRGGPEIIHCHWKTWVPPHLEIELSSLGFEPLGVQWERLAWISGRETAFASREKDCFAVVCRLGRSPMPFVSFFSAFANGATILTQSYLGGMEADYHTLRAGAPIRDVEAEEARRTMKRLFLPSTKAEALAHGIFHVLLIGVGLLSLYTSLVPEWLGFAILLGGLCAFASRQSKQPSEKSAGEQRRSVSLPEVLAEHRARIRRFLQNGYALAPANTMQSYVAGQDSYAAHPYVAWQLRGLCVVFALFVVPSLLGFAVIALGIVAACFGVEAPGWLILFLACLSLFFLRHYWQTVPPAGVFDSQSD
jgi:hypothetical protein